MPPAAPRTHAEGASVRTDGRPALSRLVALGHDDFAREHWGREALLSPADRLPGGFTDLFDAAAVDELIARRGLRTPFLRMAKAGQTLPDRSFTRGGGVGAQVADQASDEAVLAQFADGATLVLQGLHRTWGPIIDLAQQLGSDLGHPVQVNAYVTPPQNQGFDDHYDVHDVFVLQIAGEKAWRVRRPVHESPLRDQPWTGRRAEVEEAAGRAPDLEHSMRPGDCLYLPRGWLHSATALGETSIHLTIGVHTWTRHHLAELLLERGLARAADSRSVRDSLGLGVDVGSAGAIADDVEVVRGALLRAISELGPADLAGAMARRRRDSQRAAPLPPLAQAQAARNVDQQTRVALRPHLDATLTADALVSRAGRVPLDAEDGARLAPLVDVGHATAADLGEELTARLLRAGVVVPVDRHG